MELEVVTAIIAGCFTLFGVLLGILIEFYLHERRERQRFFAALEDEVQLNISVARKTLIDISSAPGRAAIATLYRPLYTQSYHNIRASGYLVTIDEEMRVKLEEVFDEIYSYNRNPMEYGEPRLKDLLQDLEGLEKELPKHLKFLN